MQTHISNPLPKTGKVLIALYVLLNPFYLWSSGLPQVSDIFAVLLILWVFVTSISKSKNGIHGKSVSIYDQGFLLCMTLFVYYAVLANLVWAIILNDKLSFIRSSFFLIFNFCILVSFSFLVIHFRDDVIRILQKTLVLSLLIQSILAVALIGSQGQRTRVFFNNPNQLGYYALLTAAILTVLFAFHRTSLLIYILSLLSSFFLAAASLSRGAIVATLFLVVCAIVFETNGRKFKFRFSVKKLLLALVVLIPFVYVLGGAIETLFSSWEDRSAAKANVDSGGLSDRGYERIFENMQYWIFGAGEGGLKRFGQGLELHSLFGNIFFSYGLIGFLIFSISIILILRGHLASLIPLGAVFLYGLSHNGIRDGFLWILIALCGSLVGSIKRPESMKIPLKNY